MLNLASLFAVPFVASLAAFLVRSSTKWPKRFSLILSLIPLAFLLYGGEKWIGSEVKWDWVPALSVEFYLKVDGISLLFLWLAAIIIPITLAAAPAGLPFSNSFYGLILFLQGLLIGFFTAADLVLFAIFWEAMLIPLYFIIAIWGGPEKKRAALKFLTYMIAGSSLLVAAILALYMASSAMGQETFNLEALAKIAPSTPYAPWLLAIFLLAFAVKTPLFPFHAWLPDAYCQAPTSGTILLSALLSKAGIYGIVRVAWPFFPHLLRAWSPYLLAFSIAGVFYGGLIAWVQKDYKRLIAYSSFSHVNFILAGLFIANEPALTGAVLQALNHGITITALFLSIGWLEERLETTAIGPAFGLAKFMPRLCWLTLFFSLSAIALPGTNNFVGELLILFGLFKANVWLSALLVLSIILSALYMLRFMRKVYFEAPSFFKEQWVDLRRKEMLIALPLAVIILWIGLYPEPIVKIIVETAR